MLNPIFSNFKDDVRYSKITQGENLPVSAGQGW